MNQKEFSTIADVFRRHRQRYEGRTDTVALELVNDMADALEVVYPKTFHYDKFMQACGLESEEQ